MGRVWALSGAFVIAALIWNWLPLARDPQRKPTRPRPGRTPSLYFCSVAVCVGSVILLYGLFSGTLPPIGDRGHKHGWLSYDDYPGTFFFESFLFSCVFFLGLKGITFFSRLNENNND
ncbi:hypothetical protein ACVILK_003518 [Bradyrhizobium embrapense]